MSALVMLAPESIEAVARRVVEMQREAEGKPETVDVWFNRCEAAAFLSLPPRTFDRKRKLHPEALKPCDTHPLRWSRNALDVFKITRGAPLHGRSGNRGKKAA